MIYLSGSIQPDLPAMRTPMIGNKHPAGQLWAADTGCFSTPHLHDDDTYLKWLAAQPLELCLFATAPDVLGDPAATLQRSLPLLPRIRELGIRAALVAQDGLELLPVPWDEFDVLFIGGSTAWKLSEASHALATEAKARGKWLHMGRVNTLRRMRIAQSIGCDSVDGTFLAFGYDRNRPQLDRFLANIDQNPMLWDQ